MKKKYLIILGIYGTMTILYLFMMISTANIEIFGINIANILIAFVISAVIAGAYLVSLVKEMNNVKVQDSAGSYTIANSFRLNAQSDKFLFSNVVKRAKSQNNSSSRNRPGGPRGGGRPGGRSGGGGRSRGGGGRSRGGGRRGGGGRRR
ncbi:MAG: hypothetical protein R3Y09_00020 [Clostridia bacterium]